MRIKSSAILTMLLIAVIFMPILSVLRANANEEPIATLTAPTIVDTTLKYSDEGTFFDVFITIEDATQIWGIQFILHFDPDILAVMEYEAVATNDEGVPFTLGPTEATEDYFATVVWSYGGDSVGLTTVDPVQVARINFIVMGDGVSMLDLEGTELADVLGGIPEHNVVDGLFDNIGAPVAAFTYYPKAPVVGEIVTFDATESYDSNEGGTIISYDWDFGDDQTGTGETTTHAYAVDGEFTITLTVTDDDELTATATMEITVFPTTWIDVVITPEFWNGETPEWKNFTVTNRGLEPIVEILIVYPEGYKPDMYAKPEGWTASPEIVLRQVTFRSTNFEMFNISRGESRRFDIHFSEVPPEEGAYTFAISGTDTEMRAVTLYMDQIIDKTAPTVSIVYPEDGDVIMGKVWVNATATDPLSGGVRSGVDHVILTINETEYDMTYDEAEGVWWWFSEVMPEEHKWYTAQATAVDRASNEGVSTEVDFYWYIETDVIVTPESGPVGTVISIEGIGFTPESFANVTFYNEMFDLGRIARVPTDEHGFFDASYTIPDTPRGVYTVNGTDDEGRKDTDTFEVLPWIKITPKEGIVGTEVTVTLTGFMNDTDIRVYYMGVATDETYDGFWWNYPTRSSRELWDGEWNWEISTMGGTVLIAEVESNEKGSVEPFTFEVPESWGGYHPVWAEEVEGALSRNEELFQVHPYIEVVPAAGVIGQCVTIYAKGFSAWEHWHKSNPTTGEAYEYERSSPIFGEVGYTSSIVLDFGPNMKYIDEPHFILNNKADLSWHDGWYTPIGLNANGTIIYYDNMYEKLMQYGSPFLQVPFLQPEEYDVTLYHFVDIEYLRYFDGEEWTLIYEFDTDYSHTESASTTFTIEKLNVQADLTEVIEKIDGLYVLIGDLEIKLDTINPIIVEIKEDTAVIKSDVGWMRIKLEDINARIVQIQGDVAIILTKLGEIQVKLNDINGKIVALEDNMATVKTDVGTIETTLDSVNTKVTVTDGNVATIKTDLGDIEGRLDSVEDNVATIKTDIGNIKVSADEIDAIKTQTDSIKSDTGLQPAVIMLSLVAAVGAIAAAVMVLRKVYVK